MKNSSETIIEDIMNEVAQSMNSIRILAAEKKSYALIEKEIDVLEKTLETILK